MTGMAATTLEPSLSGLGAPACPAAGEGVIPTAIVIKNIPFTLPQEGLAALMTDLSLPMPYAFNYHLDQGIFRGLAFANFHTPDDAEKAVAALNGFDVAGRKLRAEYKRVLKQGEKERIEKVKAIKRMQSLQLEKQKERSRRAYLQTTPSPLSLAPGAGPELNMNDPATLDIYSRILLFRDDRMQDELAFSAALSPTERQTVHLVAQRLGLQHYSLGEGAERRVVVSKAVSPFQTRTLLSRTSTPNLWSSARLSSSRSHANLGKFGAPLLTTDFYTPPLDVLGEWPYDRPVHP